MEITKKIDVFDMEKLPVGKRYHVINKGNSIDYALSLDSNESKLIFVRIGGQCMSILEVFPESVISGEVEIVEA